MVSGPARSASNCWRPVKTFVLFASLLAAAHNSAQAQTNGSSLPFGLSSFFGTSSEPAPSANRRTRIAIDLRRRSRFEVFSLNNPNRVIIELPQVGMRLPSLDSTNSNGLVRRLRAGRAAPGKSRIIIDVTEPVVVEGARVNAGSSGRGAQLEMVLVPFSSIRPLNPATLKKASFLGGAMAQPPVPRRARTGSKHGAYKPLIVIDPGHGGKDSGARKFGVNEKDVVLAFGLTLREKLEKTGRYRVKMTRSTDRFITLKGRRDIAEENNAALFIAVHADYAGSRATGATIYSLRKHLANKLRASAAAEAANEAMSNGVMKYVSASSNDLGAVRGILGDLAQREVHANLERTNIFTRIAVAQMGAATEMRSEPHREAAFKVLKTAKVPSVLIELAYVSNRRDAARLQSQKWRNEVSGSLVTAIEKYFAQSLSQIAQ